MMLTTSASHSADDAFDDAAYDVDATTPFDWTPYNTVDP
jgi:hypothetical protein